MSPEFKSIYNNLIYEIENFIPEKSDIFSLGITYLRIIILFFIYYQINLFKYIYYFNQFFF